MTGWPPLAIVVITYNRRETLRETLRRLATHLAYEGPRHIIVADDGSDDGTTEMLQADYPHIILVRSSRAGLGANTNAGLRAAFALTEYVLQLQDDMHLLTTLDMHPHIERLRDDPTAGFIRLWGVGGHKYTAQLEDNYWRVWWHSEELYIPSDRPHVKHWRFHAHFGFYPEGFPTSSTEDVWCHQCKDRAGMGEVRCDVLVPQNQLTETTWSHAHWHQRWRDQGL